MTNVTNLVTLWCDIKNYEGLYQISTLGEVRSLPKLRLVSNKKIFFPQRLLKKSITNNGYEIITLHKNGISITKHIHRLLAETFIQNPYSKKQVNHINGVKLDNRLENLEWVSCSENQIHAIKNGLRKCNLKNFK